MQSDRNYYLEKDFLLRAVRLHQHRRWYIECSPFCGDIKFIPSEDSIFPDMKIMSYAKHYMPLIDRPSFLKNYCLRK
jgi:hypothetical protein